MGHLYAPVDVEIWPENAPSWALFERLRTQWRMGPVGPVGLDYCAAYPLMDRMSLDAHEWDDALEDLRMMERSALQQISQNASEN